MNNAIKRTIFLEAQSDTRVSFFFKLHCNACQIVNMLPKSNARDEYKQAFGLSRHCYTMNLFGFIKYWSF